MLTISEVAKQIRQRDNVDISVIYCRASGEEIGILDWPMWVEVLESLQIGGMSDEEIIDDIAIRHLAFCRPSPMFNMMRADSLDRMRLLKPRVLLSYLLNRLYYAQVWTTSNPRPFEILIRNTREHIQMNRAVAQVFDTLDELQVNRLLLSLLEIDAQHGLHNLNPPKKVPAFFACLTREALDGFIDCLSDWATELRWEAHKRMQRGEVRRDSTANQAARVAFVKQFTESAPPSKTAVAKQAKQAKLNDLLALVGDILDVDSGPATPRESYGAIKSQAPSKPKLVAANPGAGGRLGSKPVRFGVKS